MVRAVTRHREPVARMALVVGVALLLSPRPGAWANEATAKTEVLSTTGPVKVGGKAPRFAGWTGGNEVIRLDRLLRPPGGEPSAGLVVSFFATWCKPCERGLPALSAVAGELAEARVPILLVAVGERTQRFAPFLKGLGVDLLAVEDRFGKISQRYGVLSKDGEGKLPRTFVLDADGIVTTILGQEGADFGALLLSSFNPSSPK